MTTHKIHRCRHCKIIYTFQASGFGAPEHNDSRYCPDCMSAVNKALSPIPKKRKCINVDTDDVTLERLLEWERESNREMEEDPSIIPVRRVFPGLFNLENEDLMYCREIKGRDEFKGRRFMLSTWEKSDEHSITKEMEQDLETGEIIGEWRQV